MTKKKTTEEFKKEVYDKVGDEYEVLGEYINNRTHIEMLHTLCGNKYTVVPSSFLAGTRCPECYGKKQKTTKEFKQEVYDLVGDEYTVLEEYKNSHTNISIKHNKCGHIYNVRPANFIHGKRCPKCMRPNHDRDTTKFKNEIVELVGDEYSLLSEYNKAREHVTIKHNICGHIYLVTPDAFLRGSRCPKCTRPNYDRDTEKFKREVYNLVGNEYTVLGEYNGSNNHILLRHNKCGYEYDSSVPSSFLKGVRCPKCARNIKKTQEDFITEVYELVKDEYQVLGEYINSNTHIKMKHTVCNHEYLVSPAKFINAGRRCPECANKIRGEKKRKTTEEFKEAVFNLVGDEYIVLGEYEGSSIPIMLQHNTCKYRYKTTTPSSFLRGARCPKCRSSKGESAIIHFLDKYKINYKHNEPYGNCSYETLLKFDFLILDYSGNSLKLICEFDGVQHFEPVDIFGGEEGFEKTKIRDKIKNDFCKDNEILLVRIPYWEIDNIPKILGKKLYKLGLL